MEYILASGSPRRRELLSLIAENFIIDKPSVNEDCPSSFPPKERPEYIAAKKANEIAPKHKDSLVIAADTAVFLDNKMLGKPRSRKEAKQMLSALSGRTHSVITGCALIYKGREERFSVETKVEFYPLNDEIIEEYIATGECDDKAGAYGIQGRGALLVRGIRGDYFNVVGLPIAELARRIRLLSGDIKA